VAPLEGRPSLITRLSTLGSIELNDPDGKPILRVLRQPKRLALLTYLAVARPFGFHRRDRILLLFWPDSDEERARAALRKSTYYLRQALGSNVIQSRGDNELAIDPQHLWCDARELDAALAEKRPADAVGLYRGALLDGFHLDGASPEFEHWLEGERNRLQKEAAEAAWDVSASLERKGDMRAAAKMGRRAFDLVPPDGERLRHLLEILDRAGDRAGALQAYERFSGWLAEEYGSEPPPETVQLIERIRSRSEARAVTAPIPQVRDEPQHDDRPPEPAATPAPRRAVKWRQVGILVGFLLAFALIPAILALRGDGPPNLDPSLVAVAPFSVLNPKHEIWSEGIVDYLSRSLDGAGELRTLAPTAAVRAWPGRADVESAEVAGRRTGAGLVVFGSLMAMGEDSVRVTATLVDVAEISVLGDLEIRGAPGRLDQLVDSLTVEILRTLSDTRQIGAMRHTSIGSRSMPALRAFLAGEQSFRRTAWDSARIQYQRAVEFDSTFAMAHLRLGSTILFIEVGGSEEGWKHVARAGELNRGVSRHDSLMLDVSADVAAARLGLLPEGRHGEIALRAYATALEATRQYPDDAESWYMVGVVRDLFYDDLPTVTVAQVADAFDRAIALDSAFAPAYRPAFRYALDEGRVEAGREYARKYLTLSPPEEASGIPLLLDRLLAPEPDEAELDSLLKDLHPETLFRTWINLWLLTDSTELAIRVARKSAEREHDPRYWTTAPHIVDRNLAASLAYRGHLRESVEVAGGDYATWFQALVPEAAMLGFVRAEVADSSFADWLDREEFDPDVLAHELWWWASRSDTSAIKRYLERGGLEPVGQAALTLARGDTAQAILQLGQVKTSRIHTNLTVLVHSRLLAAKGSPAEALEVLQSRFLNDWPLASRVVWILERARLAEQLGQPEQALRDYRFVTRVWARADPELQPRVREAGAAVRRLEE
jgi:DNA-binding SARP family transcriptional activator/TolB-like protein